MIDVLIVGAGLAALACGKRLAECGVSFRILEAADRAGGSTRTDLVDGYCIDRTFPLYLTAFPEARRVLDLEALDLKPYRHALLVRSGGQFHRFSDPRFEPCAALRSLGNSIGTIGDKLRLVRFFGNLTRGKLEKQLAREERLALDLLRWNGGFSPALIDRFFRPLAGLLFNDRSLATSSRLFRFVVRMLCEGPAAMPALGMEAIPEQLATHLPKDCLQFAAKVERIGHREASLSDGKPIRARAVVVATGGVEASRLIGGELDLPAYRGNAIIHYSAEEAPTAEPIIMLDGEGLGPVNHLTVVSNLSRGRAPEGKALIAAGIVGLPPEDATELDRRARLQLAEWFGTSVSGWKLLRVQRNPFASPDQSAGALDSWQRRVRVHPGLYVCGSHRDNASIDGALTSGLRAAQAVMEDLHEKRT
jgi:phytoene dehydrogenase-like protein